MCFIINAALCIEYDSSASPCVYKPYQVVSYRLLTDNQIVSHNSKDHDWSVTPILSYFGRKKSLLDRNGKL